MKKFFAIVLVFAVAVAFAASVGCTKTTEAAATPTPTATAVVVPPLLSYTFDASIEGWENDTPATNTGFTAVAQTTDTTNDQMYNSSAGSVEISVNLTGTNQGIFAIKSLGGTTDLTGRTITMHVWLPAEMTTSTYAINVFVQSKADWSGWENSWTTSGFVAGWNTLTFSPVSATTDEVQAIGLNIQSNGGAAVTTTIYVDEVVVQ